MLNISRADDLWEMSGNINVCLSSDVSEQIKAVLFLELDSAWNVTFSKPIIGPAIKIRISFTEATTNCNLNVQSRDFEFGTFASSAIGGSDMSVSNAYQPGVYAHEFGHNLGLFHQENFFNSMMSYSNYRSVSYSDSYRLIDGYKWNRNISTNLSAPPWK